MVNLVFITKNISKIPCQDVDFFIILGIIKTKAYLTYANCKKRQIAGEKVVRNFN